MFVQCIYGLTTPMHCQTVRTYVIGVTYQRLKCNEVFY